ncbi:hypothetical protein PHET_01585 [Paragonimus heterotremus]|uniref:Uncharacterized protein n=1 Tax=Paragonimus heterotremus TaxID=100268 RepID=A0A8J4TLU2_9TREM|nr:hypothetical protein PHET_01585 [Paragonimus heterotremus]
MNSNVTAFLGDTVPRITIGDVDEAEQILEQKPQAINHVRLSQNLPNSATVKLDGSLNLLVTQPEDVDGTFYCIASNIVGSVMSSVELLYEANDDERPKANRLQSMTVMIEGFQVQPQSFGVWISWKPNLNMDVINTDRVRILVEQGIISSQSTIADKNTTCYYVVYSRLVRTREKWRSVRVQPLAVHKLWLGGFIPDEAYAFKLARWCAADKPSARSPVVYQKTKPFISFAALEGRFHGTLESTDDQIPVVQTPSSLLPRPHSLHLLLPRALNHITSNWQSGELYTSDSTFLLRWKVGGTDSEQNAFSSILYHRVEYFLGFVDGTTTFHFPTTLVWLPNVTNSWHTLAPIRAPQKSFALITEQNDLSDVLSDSLSRVFISSMRLRFRVRSYGLLCVSEPSQELHIEEPLLGHVLPVLNRTVAREQLSLKVMSEHPNSVSSPTTHPVEHFGSVKFTLGISNRLWYTMSCSVLVCVLLCFIVLIAYRVYQMRCMRKTINVTVAEVNQSPCENNRLLINQLRLGLPGLPIYHQRPPEFTNTLTDLKQRVNKPVAEVEAYPELKQSIFSHKAYPIKPSLNLPLGWNNLNSLQCQNASSSKVASDKPASVGSQIGFASNCRNISCIVVHENESPKWTDSHTSHLGCTFTNVTDSSLVDNICQTHNIMHHAGMSGSQLRPISEVLCLDYTDEVQRNKLHSRSSNTNEVEERTEIQQTEQSNWTDFFDLSNHLPPTASPWNGTMCTVVPPSLVPQCSARGSSDAYTTCKSNYLILPLDLKSYPTQPSENVHLIAYVPCETNCLPLLDSTDPLISSVNTLPTERQIEPFIHKLTKQPAWKQNE